MCKTNDGKDLGIILREVFLKEEESKEIGFIGYLFDITELRRQEEDLRESRRSYYELVESVNSIVMRMDTKGTITFINRFAEELFGYTRDELIGRNTVGTITPEEETTSRDLRKMTHDILREPEKFKANVNENMRKNGERIWVSWTNKPVFDEQGRVAGVMCSGNDITELKRREEELEESKAYFQDFFNASPVPLTLIDLEGKRVDCNPAMERLMGRKKEELINIPVEAAYAREERPLVRKKLVEETIEKGYMHGFETHFVIADGSELPIVADTALLRNKEGKPQAIVYSATDISELQKREEELKKAQTYTAELLSTMPDPLCVVNIEGIRVDGNPALERITGLSREELIGKPSNRIMVEEDRPKTKELLEETIEKGSVKGFELTILTKGGKKIPVLADTGLRRDEKGNPTGAILNFRDITELQKREEAVKESRDFASALFSNLPLPASLSTPEGARIDVNERCLTLYKRSKEEWIGAELEAMYEAEDAPKITKALEDCRKVGHGSCEVIAIRGDGTKFPTVLDFSPLKDKGGGITNIIATASDITDLKQKEKEIADAKSYNEQVIEHIADGLCVVDNEGNWLITNPAMAKITGYNQEELLGRKTEDHPFWQLPEAQEATKEMWERVNAGETATGVEMPWVRKEGKRIIISSSEQSLKDTKGNVIGEVFVARDITDLKTATEEVARALEAVSNGDYTQKVDLSGLEGDLAEMGENVNKTIGSIERFIDQLEDAKKRNEQIILYFQR